MANILQDAGRTLLATLIKSQPIHIGWGRGDPDWDDNPPGPLYDATALQGEVGRRLATAVEYVQPDPAGEIEMPTGERYTISPTPTANLYVRAVFGWEDADGETIRELGLFIGTQTDPGLPPGQRYFLPAQVIDPGTLYLLNRDERYLRTATSYQSVELVLPF